MMQGAWEPLIQKLSCAAARGPIHKDHARRCFYNLHTTYALKPVVYALSPSSIRRVKLSLLMLAMLLHSVTVHVFFTALPISPSPSAAAAFVSHRQ